MKILHCKECRISKPWSPEQLCYRLQPSKTPVISQGKKPSIPLVGWSLSHQTGCFERWRLSFILGDLKPFEDGVSGIRFFVKDSAWQQYLIQMRISEILWRNRLSSLDPHHVKYWTPSRVTHCLSKAMQCAQSLVAPQSICIIWWHNTTSSQDSSFKKNGLPRTIILISVYLALYFHIIFIALLFVNMRI